MMTEKMGYEKNKGFAKDFHNKRETVSIGGKLCNFRSKLEHKVAVYLEILKQGKHIKDWAFEQTTFDFQNPILKKYIMDFDVIRPDGSFYYIETKGYMDKHGRDRITVLLTERPEVELWVVFQNKRDKVKFERRKISRQCKRICLLSELIGGLI
jgi:hypothetical protein